MNHYLILWKTWIEHEIETPWPFLYVDKTLDFKKRSNSQIRVSPESAQEIYNSFNIDKIAKFEDEYIDAVILSAVIYASGETEAAEQIVKLFSDAEIVEIVYIEPDMLEKVLETFSKE